MFGNVTSAIGLNSMMSGPATSPYSGYSSNSANLVNQAMQGLLGSSGLANQSLAQQQMSAWNQSITKPAKWMFDGKVCDVREMANKIWHEDCPEKTHFILKYE